MLILYSETLLNSLISSRIIFVASLGFCKYTIISSVNRDSLFLPFKSVFFFISVSFLITVARTSGDMLNKNAENRHHCPAPGLREKAVSLSHQV